MDSSIMKFLEEDEDETLHSGADLEAFTAALNRDIDGGNSPPPPSASNGGNCHASNQFSQWQTTTSHGQNTMSQSLRDDLLRKEQNSSEMMIKQHGPDAGNQYQKISSQDANQPPQDSRKDTVHIQEQNRTQNPEPQRMNIHAESVSTQQSISMAMSAQRLISTGMSGQRLMLTGMSGQQMRTTGVNNQKGVVQCTSIQHIVSVPKTGLQLPLNILIPQLQAQLDKDRGMQLQTSYIKLMKNEISMEIFSKHVKTIVGDHMLKMTVCKFQTQAARNTDTGPSKLPMQSQASAQQQQQQQTPLNVRMSTDVNNLKFDSREHQSDLQGTQERRVSSSGLSATKHDKEHLPFPNQVLNKQQQQHLHFPQASFPTYVNKGNNGTNSSSTSAHAKPQHQEMVMRPIRPHQIIGATQIGDGSQTMNMVNAPNTERKSSLGEPRRTVTNMTSSSMTQRSSVQWQSSTNKEQRNVLPSPIMNLKSEPVDHFPELQHKSEISSPSFYAQGGCTVKTSIDEPFDLQSSIMNSSSASDGPSKFRSTPMASQVDSSSLLNSYKPPVTSPNETGNNGKTPVKNPSVGQKRPLETLSSLPPLSSKKQKASGDILCQSIEQLNDITAYSGVNLREEEEQLFSGPNEDGRVSEASLRAVKEEEERLILQKIPLQKKLSEIMRKCGLNNRSSDVERCLSLCVEERMRVLITTLIRFSKQRVDIEKLRHRTIITSDVQKQIMVINGRAQEEWEKQQAEIGKSQTDESGDNTSEDGDKEKDEGHAKSVKVNKGEDEKTRATAANVAARAATGGDDMLSKWQLMAEQAKQKREGSGPTGKDSSDRPLSTLTRNTRDNQEPEKGSSSSAINTPGTVRKVGRNQVVMPRIARSITIKDVIAVLETEPQLSKSTLVYRLYERIRFDGSAV